MHAIELRPYGPPGVPCLHFSYPDKKERQIAQADVRSDALFFSVVDGSKIQRVLEVRKSPLDFGKLLVAKGDVLRREGIIRGRKQELTVKTLFGLDLGRVDDEGAIGFLFEVAP